MDASREIPRSIHRVRLNDYSIFKCPDFWVHIIHRFAFSWSYSVVLNYTPNDIMLCHAGDFCNTVFYRYIKTLHFIMPL